MAVLGKTQTGKTATVREMHATNSRVSIWVNERGTHRVPDVASEGQTVRSIAGLKAAFGRNQYKINFLPSDRNEALPQLRQWLWDVADRTDRDLPIQVIVDEVDRAAPQSQKAYGNLPARDAIRDFCSEGVKRNIKFVGITQDPSTYDKKALRQSEYRLVYPMSAEQQDAVSRYGFDWPTILNNEQYAGVLHSAEGKVLDDHVKAAARYA